MRRRHAPQPRFPWTWVLLGLVAADLVCRTNPLTAGLTPWIDGLAVLGSFGVLFATPQAVEAVSRS
ncbi:MAG: hypothetical protein KC933_31980 [Myxococcales bacterium]|nr:hypothetical protein [Myxococcales bacterium]MCB9648568.1 hypothetical protein [Deltaproteobacteria bacterium]